MQKSLSILDIIVFLIYFVFVAGYGFWIYSKKKNNQLNSNEFFLAEGQLTWWAIGASLIASNISAEQFIGMSGNGFRLGLAISAYEWIAALSLIVVAVFFMPVYLKNSIFTMPQFLQKRYDSRVALIMAIFWLFLYVFVNLTSILYLGTIAINNLCGGDHFEWIMIGLALFALIISLGGMKVIGYTDVIQVIVLLVGGLITTYIALTIVGETFGLGKNALAGFNALLEKAPDHFDLIFDKPAKNATGPEVNNYLSLPGLAMMAGGMWIANLNYWGCNQYITQRALGADLKTARTGILFSALLKIIMPILVVLPGIAAYVLYQEGQLKTEMLTNGELREDNAYSAILTFLPTGLRGLSMAALTAAIVASLAGKVNSISTIFTLDIYKKYLKKDADDAAMIRIGKWVVLVAILLAVIVNWNDIMGIGGKGGFEYIQKYTGYVSPAIFPVFLFGFFWKRTTSKAAIAGIIGGVMLAIFFDKFAPSVLGNENFLYTAYQNSTNHYEIPFLIQMGWAFFFTSLLIIIVSLLDQSPQSSNVMEIDKKMFRLTTSQYIISLLIIAVILGIYIRFW